MAKYLPVPGRGRGCGGGAEGTLPTFVGSRCGWYWYIPSRYVPNYFSNYFSMTFTIPSHWHTLSHVPYNVTLTMPIIDSVPIGPAYPLWCCIHLGRMTGRLPRPSKTGPKFHHGLAKLCFSRSVVPFHRIVEDPGQLCAMAHIPCAAHDGLSTYWPLKAVDREFYLTVPIPQHKHNITYPLRTLCRKCHLLDLVLRPRRPIPQCHRVPRALKAQKCGHAPHPTTPLGPGPGV